MSDTVLTQRKLGTRAVVRRVEPGSIAPCAACGEAVRFAAREQRLQIIANVYVDDRWNRVEHFHDGCYREAGEPHGAPRD